MKSDWSGNSRQPVIASSQSVYMLRQRLMFNTEKGKETLVVDDPVEISYLNVLMIQSNQSNINKQLRISKANWCLPVSVHWYVTTSKNHWLASTDRRSSLSLARSVYYRWPTKLRFKILSRGNFQTASSVKLKAFRVIDVWYRTLRKIIQNISLKRSENHL